MAKKKQPKLIFDFNTANNLEVWSSKLKDWFRMTANEFRSWNGKRRVQGVDYEGAVFIYDTNTIIYNTENYPEGVIFEDNKDPRVFGCRPGERHLVEKLKEEGIQQNYKNIKIR